MTELQTLILRCRNRTEDIPTVVATCNDILMGIGVVVQNQAIQYLSQDMRDTFIQGVTQCLHAVCEEAWSWYMRNDVPITNETIPLLRTIVHSHFIGGGSIGC